MILFSYLVRSTAALFRQNKPNDDLKGSVTQQGNRNAFIDSLSGNPQQSSEEIF